MLQLAHQERIKKGFKSVAEHMACVKHNRYMDSSPEILCSYLYLALMGEAWN
jgi:hypothetical protein